MSNELNSIPPRNGEGDREAQPRGGGVFATNRKTIKRARRERRSGNLTEVILWREMWKRPSGFRFRRQHPIGPYILDFACLRPRVAIEIDGMAHDMGDRPQRDRNRESWLAHKGFAVVRFTAQDVLDNLESVVRAIVEACSSQPLHHLPKPVASADGPPPHNGEVFEGTKL